MGAIARLSGSVGYTFAGFGLMLGWMTEAQAIGLALVCLPSLFAGGRD